MQREFAQDVGVGVDQEEKLLENTTELENTATGGALDARANVMVKVFAGFGGLFKVTDIWRWETLKTKARWNFKILFDGTKCRTCATDFSTECRKVDEAENSRQHNSHHAKKIGRERLLRIEWFLSLNKLWLWLRRTSCMATHFTTEIEEAWQIGRFRNESASCAIFLITIQRQWRDSAGL